MYLFLTPSRTDGRVPSQRRCTYNLQPDLLGSFPADVYPDITGQFGSGHNPSFIFPKCPSQQKFARRTNIMRNISIGCPCDKIHPSPDRFGTSPVTGLAIVTGRLEIKSLYCLLLVLSIEDNLPTSNQSRSISDTSWLKVVVLSNSLVGNCDKKFFATYQKYRLQSTLFIKLSSCLFLFRFFFAFWKTGTGASEKFVMILVPSGLKKDGVSSP